MTDYEGALRVYVEALAGLEEVRQGKDRSAIVGAALAVGTAASYLAQLAQRVRTEQDRLTDEEFGRLQAMADGNGPVINLLGVEVPLDPGGWASLRYRVAAERRRRDEVGDWAQTVDAETGLCPGCSTKAVHMFVLRVVVLVCACPGRSPAIL